VSEVNLPECLSPLVTHHPASVAYRITMSPHEWTWTQAEQEEIAKAVVERDAQLTALEQERGQLKAKLASLEKGLPVSELNVWDFWQGECDKAEALVTQLTRERDQLKAELAQAKAAFDPVLDWYDGDGRFTNFAEMLAGAIADLKSDRAEVLALRTHNAALIEACEAAKKWRDATVELPEANTVVAVFYGAKECDGADVGKWDGQKWILRSLKPESHCGIWKVLGWHPLPEPPEHWSFNTIDAAIALEKGEK